MDKEIDHHVQADDQPNNDQSHGDEQEVIRSILSKANRGESVYKVDLSDRQLTKILPETFVKLHALVSLDLSHNQLQEIPDSIAGLIKLEELNLSANLLESLPDSIGLLINLRIFDVSSNKLKALPASIAGCRSLVELDASYNSLTFLPKNIGYGLTNLEKLNISLNKIRILPNSICEMRCLKNIDVHFNELHGLPHSMSKLKNLELLNASSNFNDLTEIPETICELSSLRELDLGNNQIRALPDEFFRLDNLCRLNLDQNPLVVPPMEVVGNGIEAVKEFMRMRRIVGSSDAEDEQRKMELEAGWFSWGVSVVDDFVSQVSNEFSGFFGGNKVPEDPLLDQQS